MPVFYFSKAYIGFAGIIPYCSGNMAFKMLMGRKVRYIMKIVVVKSPRFLAGFLRLFFGIKKSEGA